MDGSGDEQDRQGNLRPAPASNKTDGFASATLGHANNAFGHHPPGNVNIQVNTDTVNLHASNLAALERIAAVDPGVAHRIIESTDKSLELDQKKYTTAAIAAGIICCLVLILSAIVIINSGFWSGIAFFLACVAVAAIVAAIFTGKTMDMSWTVGMVPGSSAKNTNDSSENGKGNS